METNHHNGSMENLSLKSRSSSASSLEKVGTETPQYSSSPHTQQYDGVMVCTESYEFHEKCVIMVQSSLDSIALIL